MKIKEELQLQEEIERLTRQLKGRSRSGVGGCGSQLLEVSKVRRYFYSMLKFL